MPDRSADLHSTARRTLFTRLRVSWSKRGPFLRRAASLALVLIAGMLAMAPQPASEDIEERTGPGARTVVTTGDLPSGHVLSRADLTLEAIPERVVPDGAQQELSSLEGRTLGSPVRAGEPVTDVRLVSPALTRLTTGDSDHTAVAIHLAEPAIANLLHPGRRVDLVTTDPRNSAVLAENVPVLALRPGRGAEDEREQLVMVGLPRPQAAPVAAAAVAQTVTVTLR